MDSSWNGLADLISNLITKYASVLDVDNLPNPTLATSNNISSDNFGIAKIQIEIKKEKCNNKLEMYVQTNKEWF